MKKYFKKILATVLVLLTVVAPTMPVDAASDYIWPTDTHTMSRNYAQHNNKAIDISVSSGTSIYASRSGTVYAVYTGCNNHSGIKNGTCKKRGLCSPSNGYYSNGFCNNGFGNGVIIKHDDGTYAHYAHFSTVSVKKGDSVTQGQIIGTSGDSGNSSGPHLHFELHKSGASPWKGATINPETVFGGTNPVTISVSVSTTTVESITQTSALVRGKFTVTGAKATECGMYMGTSQSAMSKLGYDPINKSSTTFYYNTGNCGWTLEPGTTYYYRAYVIINGKEYLADNIESFTTLPPDTTNVPTKNLPEKVTVTLSSSSIVEGESVTVSWDTAPSATRYELYYIANGIFGKKNTDSTLVTLSGLSQGTYEVSVIAINESGRTESNTQTLTVSAKQAPVIGSNPATTPTPAPPVTYYCFVNTDTGYLAIRESASSGSEQKGRIPSGAAVTVNPDKSSGSWYYVEYSGVSGYASSKYLTSTAPTTMTGTVTGTKGEYLAINDAAASSSSGKSNKIGRIPPGGTVTVYVGNNSGNWYWVRYGEIYGWAYSGYITLS